MSSEIQFDEDSLSTASKQNQSSNGGIGGNEPGMVRWMLAHNLAKSPATAQGILIGGVLVLIVASFILITNFL
jgi:hypothetical protein